MQFLLHAVNLVHHAIRDKITSTKRSNKWPALEKKHLQEQPNCAACGSNRRLNVHHKLPFHIHPELELDPTNLITLCMDRDCHIYTGHNGNFKNFNPHVVEDSATLFSLKDSSDFVARQKDLMAIRKQGL